LGRLDLEFGLDAPELVQEELVLHCFGVDSLQELAQLCAHLQHVLNCCYYAWDAQETLFVH